LVVNSINTVKNIRRKRRGAFPKKSVFVPLHCPCKTIVLILLSSHNCFIP